MKKQLRLFHLGAVIAIVLMMMISISASAHSGGTDSKGGHYNHSTGEYHYHHGHPAHQHPDGVCPYKSNNSSKSLTDLDRSSPAEFFLGLTLVIIFGCPLLLSAIYIPASIIFYFMKRKDLIGKAFTPINVFSYSTGCIAYLAWFFFF